MKDIFILLKSVGCLLLASVELSSAPNVPGDVEVSQCTLRQEKMKCYVLFYPL